MTASAIAWSLAGLLFVALVILGIALLRLLPRRRTEIQGAQTAEAEAETTGPADTVQKYTIKNAEMAFPAAGGPKIAGIDKTVLAKNPRVEIKNYFALNGDNWQSWEELGAELEPMAGCDRDNPLSIKGIWRNLENRRVGIQLGIGAERWKEQGFVFVGAPKVYINDAYCGEYPNLLLDDESKNKVPVSIPKGGKAKIICQVQFRPGETGQAPDGDIEPRFIDYARPIAPEEPEAGVAKPAPEKEKAEEEEEEKRRREEEAERRKEREEKDKRRREEREEKEERRRKQREGQRLSRAAEETISEVRGPAATATEVPAVEPRREERREEESPEAESPGAKALSDALVARGYPRHPKIEPSSIGYRAMSRLVDEGKVTPEEVISMWETEEGKLRKTSKGDPAEEAVKKFRAAQQAQPVPVAPAPTPPTPTVTTEEPKPEVTPSEGEGASTETEPPKSNNGGQTYELGTALSDEEKQRVAEAQARAIERNGGK